MKKYCVMMTIIMIMIIMIIIMIVIMIIITIIIITFPRIRIIEIMIKTTKQ